MVRDSKAKPDGAGRKNGGKGGACRHQLGEMRRTPEAIRRLFENGEYPYHTKMRRAAYEKQKAELQVELLKDGYTARMPLGLQQMQRDLVLLVMLEFLFHQLLRV